MLQDTHTDHIAEISISMSELGMVDAPSEKAFDNLTKFALKLVGAPVALVSIVQEENDRQYFKSQQGLPEPWATSRQTPLSHSFCQHVKRSNEPLIVENAHENQLVCDNLAVRDLNVIAYLGVPIHDPAHNAIGALCVIDDKPRVWTDYEIAVMQSLATCVSDEILLRASLKHNENLREQLKTQFARAKRYNALRESVSMAFMVPDMPLADRFRLMLQTGCEALGMEFGCIAQVEGDAVSLNFASDITAETTELTDADISGMLLAQVISGQEQVCIQDAKNTPHTDKLDVLKRNPASYIAAPLILNGVMYGAIEFSTQERRTVPCTGEEQSILSMMAMLTCSSLEAYNQIRKAKMAESQSLSYLLDQRAQSREQIASLKRANG